MSEISDFCDSNSLTLVEDSCQSLVPSLTVNTQVYLVWLDLLAFSAKTLGTFGDGGAVVTNDDSVASHIRL